MEVVGDLEDRVAELDGADPPCGQRVDAERGPRLPTLFLALGSEKVRSLLTP
mgnify:CR=1 FL=1